MNDIFTSYENGLTELLDRLGNEHPSLADVLIYQQRLLENIGQARRYGDTERRQAERAQIVDALNQLARRTVGVTFNELCPSATKADDTWRKVRHNLPQPDYGQFIGREQELAQVVRILRPYPHSQHALVTIDGVGGIGKSALALEVAHRFLRNYDSLPPEERFDAIIWTSAKQAVLTAEGIMSRRQVLRTIDDIYRTIAVTLGIGTHIRTQPEERADLVRNALTQQRTLLLVDNLETIDDEAVLEFLREIPAPTKAIVTTRHRINVAYPVRLVGMPWEDTKALIEQEYHKKGVTLREEQGRKLYDRTGGVPLAIVWSIAQMGFGYGIDAVLTRLGNPKGDIARFCFEGSVERIRGKDSHKLLMALALLKTSGSREVLGHIAGLADDILSRDEGLVELERLSLVSKHENQFSMLPLTKQFAVAELLNEPDEVLSSMLGRLAKSGEANVIEAAEWVSRHKERITEDALELIIDELVGWMDQYAYYGDEYTATYYSGMLEAIGGPRVVALFKGIVRQPYGGYYHLDQDCVFALGRMGHHGFLIETLSSDNVEEIRKACADAIGLSRNPEYLPILRDLLGRENGQVVAEAIQKAIMKIEQGKE